MSGETRISTERLQELIAGWMSNVLPVEFDGNDMQFNDNCRDTAQALRELAETRREWQPIETAPKDGRWILVTWAGQAHRCEAMRHDEGGNAPLGDALRRVAQWLTRNSP